MEQKNKKILKKIPFNKLSIFTALVLGCNILGGVGYFALNPIKPTVLGVVSGKDGYKLRYSKTTNGALTFTGNSLCLSDNQAQGTCATFISTDQNLSDSPYGAGTTNDWTKDGSEATLSLPADSEILYAELVWGGSFKDPSQDLTSFLDKPVQFTSPKGVYQVKPTDITAAEVVESSAYAYVRSADVTDLIKTDGQGKYTLGNVPATMDRDNPYNNYAGWTLAVAYRDLKQPPRNISIFVGSEIAGADQQSNIAEVKGFATPTSGNVSGRLLVSAQEGDSCYSGDQIKFGQTKKSLKSLSGPNNNINNFFASQINNDKGNIDKSGSFGSKNQSVGSCGDSKRQGWDITNVDISSLLSANQTTAYAQGTSQGDVYLINALGMQIDVNAAKPNINLKVDKAETKIGDVLTYSGTITNTGTADSINSILTGQAPEGTSFVDGSLKIGGSQTDSSGPTANLGTIKPNQSLTFEYQVKVNSVPASNKFINQANLDYQYIMANGEAPITDITKSQEVVTLYNENPNLPPVATNDSKSTQYQTPVTIDVLANDTDPNGNIQPSSLSVTKQPTNGTTTISENTVIYSPKLGFSGTDTFEYSICDTGSMCDTATVTVTTAEKPTEILAPNAADDIITTEVNTSANVDILKNDTYLNQKPDKIALNVVSNPTNGTVALNSLNEFVYTPNTDFAGTDTFEYKLCDETTLCDTAKVTINITKPNPNPLPSPGFVAQNDTKATIKNTPVTVDVLNNDGDSANKVNPQSLAIQTQPTNGVLEILNNQIKYSPKADFTGTDTFEYKICSMDSLCTTATVTVDVSDTVATTVPKPTTNTAPTNTKKTVLIIPSFPAPIAVDDQALTALNTKIAVNVSKNDSAPKDTLDLASVKITQNAKNGTVITNSNDGNIQYTPNTDYIGLDTFKYEICNSHKVCASANVTVQVNKQNIENLNGATTVTPSANLDQNTSPKANQADKQAGNQANKQAANTIELPTTTDQTSQSTAQQDVVSSNQPQTQTDQPGKKPQVAGVIDKQNEGAIIEKNAQSKGQVLPKGQVLGVFENKELIRTGGELGFKILLPLNLALIGVIFVINRILDKKEENTSPIYE